jgi:FixJ family two-component response regulator
MNSGGPRKIMSIKHQPVEAPLVSIVDDDLSVRRSTGRLLRTAGLRVETFASAEEFLTSGRAKESDCIILDFQMPGMNGLELQRHLAENSIPAPIVFITAHASEDEQRQALQAGAVKFLHKPVSKEVLLLSIRSALGNPPIDERKTP